MVRDIEAMGEKVASEPANECEHCHRPAPTRKRFCSEACVACEHESENEETGCDNICGLDGQDDGLGACNACGRSLTRETLVQGLEPEDLICLSCEEEMKRHEGPP